MKKKENWGEKHLNSEALAVPGTVEKKIVPGTHFQVWLKTVHSTLNSLLFFPLFHIFFIIKKEEEEKEERTNKNKKALFL